MSKELVTNYKDTFKSIALHLNAINLALNGKVDLTNYNTFLTTITNQLNELQTDLNTFEVMFELYDGMHFYSDQSQQKIYLKNAQNVTITELNVGWLNNEGTTITYNPTTNNLELRNDAGELLSVIPVGSFVSNIGNTIAFNQTTKYILELRDNSGIVKSSTEIGIENVKNLQLSLDSIKTIYNNDGILNNNRTIQLTDKSLKFVSSGDTFEFINNKLIIPSLHTNKYGITIDSSLLTPTLVNNLPILTVGNNTLEKLYLAAKNFNIKNVKLNDGSANKTLVINDNGDLMYQSGILAEYIAGEGITINGNTISLTPADKVKLVFEW